MKKRTVRVTGIIEGQSCNYDYDGNFNGMKGEPGVVLFIENLNPYGQDYEIEIPASDLKRAAKFAGTPKIEPKPWWGENFYTRVQYQNRLVESGMDPADAKEQSIPADDRSGFGWNKGFHVHKYESWQKVESSLPPERICYHCNLPREDPIHKVGAEKSAKKSAKKSVSRSQ